jgi:hypothetical protein
MWSYLALAMNFNRAMGKKFEKIDFKAVAHFWRFISLYPAIIDLAIEYIICSY